MLIKIQLRKLLNPSIRSALKKVMEKWKNPKDIYSFIKIAETLDKVHKNYQDTVKVITDSMGVDSGHGKSVDGNVIMSYLLSQYGKVGSDGNWTLAGIEQSQLEEYLGKRVEAEKSLDTYNKEMEKLFDEYQEIEISRLIKISEKDITKEIITAHDIYLLIPFFDLADIGGSEEENTAPTGD